MKDIIVGTIKARLFENGMILLQDYRSELYLTKEEMIGLFKRFKREEGWMT